jgi:hypothetical protein
MAKKSKVKKKASKKVAVEAAEPAKSPTKAKKKDAPTKAIKKHEKFAKKLAKAEAKLKKRAAKLDESKATLGGPIPVHSGEGATPAEIGAAIVAAFNRGEGDRVAAQYWSDAIESVEGHGVNMGWYGREAVNQKNADWTSQNRILGGVAEGPFCGSSGFAIKFRIETQTIATGEKRTMDEVGVYTVRDGKIVREEFMYGG